MDVFANSVKTLHLGAFVCHFWNLRNFTDTHKAFVGRTKIGTALNNFRPIFQQKTTTGTATPFSNIPKNALYIFGARTPCLHSVLRRKNDKSFSTKNSYVISKQNRTIKANRPLV